MSTDDEMKRKLSDPEDGLEPKKLKESTQAAETCAAKPESAIEPAHSSQDIDDSSSGHPNRIAESNQGNSSEPPVENQSESAPASEKNSFEQKVAEDTKTDDTVKPAIEGSTAISEPQEQPTEEPQPSSPKGDLKEEGQDTKGADKETAKSTDSQSTAEKPSQPKANPLFGAYGSGFNFAKQGNNAQKDDNKPTKTEAAEAKPEPAGTKPNPLFGAFGSKFSFGNSKEADSSSSAKPFGSFGSQFKFGESSGLGALASVGSEKAKSVENPWAEERKEVEESKTDKYAVVDVKEQTDVKTGEEEEDVLFDARARLYALVLSDTLAGWKERATGSVHLNTHRATKKHRIIMRADSLYKVVLNLPIGSGTKVTRGFPSSAASERFVRITGSEETGKLTQFALRLQTANLANELHEKISLLLDD